MPRKARRACAYESALRYLAVPRTLLAATRACADAAQLGFGVDMERACCEFFKGNLEAASMLVASLLAGQVDRVAKGPARAPRMTSGSSSRSYTTPALHATSSSTVSRCQRRMHMPLLWLHWPSRMDYALD